MKKNMRAILLTAILGSLPAVLLAQQPVAKVEIADKIVAVVGDSVILKSDVDLEIQQMKQMNQPLGDSVVTYRKIVERRVGELVLIQAATRDTSIQVTEEKIATEVQREMDARRRQFGSDAQFQTALAQAGMTLDELRRQISQDIGGRTLLREFVSKMSRDRKAPPVTDDVIKKYYEENKASFGVRPATITFSQIVVTPTPSDTARATARAKAEEALKAVRAGGDFETLAKQYSEDPTTREKGGDLGWFRSGSMVKEFNDVAFALRAGETSGIVETSFGFHIIKVEKVKGAERQARHILIIPTVTADDAERIRSVANDIATKVRNGANFDSLAKAVGDPNEQMHVGPYPKDKLPEPYNTQLATATPGTVVGPIELAGAGASKFAVVKVTETRESGEYSLDDPDFRTELRQTVAQNTLVEELVRDLKKRTLVEYRLD